MHITPEALNKIEEISPDGPFEISVFSNLLFGTMMNLEVNSLPDEGSVTIELHDDPHVITDLKSVTYLTNRTLDFDVTAKEFIITGKNA
jgi:Fe-S cluster assembly iron-binding protein IscA